MIQSIENRTANTRATALGMLVAALMAAGVLLVAAAPLATPAVAAVTFGVDRNDDPDPATAKACTDAPNDCSLRGAIGAANAATGADTVTVPAGTYALTREGGFEDVASTGDLDVTEGLTLTGAGAGTTSVIGGPAPFDDRIFDNRPGAKTAITGLTIAGGDGGNFHEGGGVRNGGDLTLDGVVVKDNTASVGGGIDSRGGDLTLDGVAVKGNTSKTLGGIFSEKGTLSITDSTVSGNSAAENWAGVLHHSGTANITNSTISGNKAAQSGGGLIAASATVNVRNSTIASNTSGGVGGGIVTVGPGSTVAVRNTIVAGNTLNNCADFGQAGGVIFSQGNNLSSDDSCGFTKAGDRQNTDPRLGPLQDNGGPTDTHALLAGSPAVDAGTNTECPATDQRGVARPQGLRCDMGAFERPNSPPTAVNNSYRGKEDRVLRVPARGVLANDTDPDGDALGASVVSRPGKGALSLNSNGALTYKPKRNFSGKVSFVYRADDGHGGTDTATVSIRIAARPG